MDRRLFTKLCLGTVSAPLFAMEKPKEQKNETKKQVPAKKIELKKPSKDLSFEGLML